MNCRQCGEELVGNRKDAIYCNRVVTIDTKVKGNAGRIAVMTKSRYGTENFMYSIANDLLLKEDRTPL